MNMGIFTPIYMKKNQKGKRNTRAIEKIRAMTDIGKLTEAFRAAPDSWIRREAANRLIDLKVPEALLAEIAERTDSDGIADRALNGVSDAALLERIARAGKHQSIRRSAARSIEDQAALERLASSDTDAFVRSIAIWRLENQTVLAGIALDARTDASLRSTATGRISDVNALRRIVLSDADAAVREQAAKSPHLDDPGTLALVAKQDRDPKVRKAAVANANLKDPAVLAEIALGSDDRSVRAAAVRGGRIADSELLKKIALDKGDDSPRVFAVDQLEDIATLQMIAGESDTLDPRPRWLAAIKLSRAEPALAVAPLVRLMVLDKDAHWGGDFCLCDLRREAVHFLKDRYKETRDEAIAGLPDGMYGWIEPGDACMPLDEKIHFDLARGRK